jgi:4-amino-4-deoxy-L-arabinose transferase-like glycosyltransferase
MRWRDLLLIGLLALVLFIPGQASIPPIDRDESRYAVATTQMLASGDLIDIRFQDEPRYLPPAGIYWLHSLSVLLLSEPSSRAIWAHRVPSLLGAFGAVLLTALFAARHLGRATGLIAGTLLATSLLLSVEARMAKIDATMLLVVTVAQSLLLLLYLDRAQMPQAVATGFWAALGVGLMLKGPVPTMVSLLTILVITIWDRNVAWLKRLRAGWGILITLGIVLPWLVAITIRTDGAFLSEALGHSLLGKVATGQQAHGAPPGYHLLAFTIAFWPGALFAVLAVPHVWRHGSEALYRFLIAWIVPTWLVFELVATKLPHYTLPTYPAIATLAAAALVAGSIHLPTGRWRIPARIYLGLWALVGIALASAGAVITYLSDRVVAWPAAVAAVVAIGLVVLAVRRLASGDAQSAFTGAVLAAGLVWCVTFGVTLPSVDRIWMSQRIVAAAEAAAACGTPMVITTPFHEPSLVFQAGPDRTHLAKTPEEAADVLQRERQCAVAIVGQREEPRFRARAEVLALTVAAADHVEGQNYSNGRRLSLTVFRPSPSGS